MKRKTFKKENRVCHVCSGLGIVTFSSCENCWGTGESVVWSIDISTFENKSTPEVKE